MADDKSLEPQDFPVRVQQRNIVKNDGKPLAVVAVVLGYQSYQARQKTTGVEISIGERGISIEKK